MKVFEAILPDAGMILTGKTPVAQYVSYTVERVTRRVSGAFQAETLTVCMAPKAHRILISSVGRVRVAEGTCS
jgi:type IV fimbrial biogenesis protein FimT